MSLGLLYLGVTVVTNPLRVLEIGHHGLLAGAICTKYLTAVSAMMFAIRDCELRIAQNAVVGLGVIGPFPTALFGQLNLYALVFPA